METSGANYSVIPAPARPVRLTFQPQDDGILPREEFTVSADGLGDGLQGARLRIQEADGYSLPHPDAQGNYLVNDVRDPRFDDVQAYATVDRVLRMSEAYIGRPLHFGFADALGRDYLTVRTHQGTQTDNGWYAADRGTIDLFGFTDANTHEFLRIAQFPDFVSHESGHAVLDAIRHCWVSSMGATPFGIHEAFGDMTAMLAGLQSRAVVDRMYDETGGDLSKPNVLAKWSERDGAASEGHDWERLFINDFKYTDPHFLPYQPSKDQPFTLEPHQYSQLLSGSFYQLLGTLQQQFSTGPGKEQFATSMAQARDVAGRLLFRAMEFAPVGTAQYKDVALAFIKADAVDNEGKYRPVLEKLFEGRGILRSEDLTAYDQHESKLPALTAAPGTFATEEGTLDFLKAHAADLGLPDHQWNCMETHTGAKGETFVTLGYKQAFDLLGSTYGSIEGARALTNGGLLLAFDSRGKLIESTLDEVTPLDIENIQDFIKRTPSAINARHGLVPHGQYLEPDATLHD